MPVYDYDMLVIGSGPAGQRAAIQAAKLDKRVALVERKTVVGGVCVNTGTIPSKTLREAVLHLSGFRERGFYGASYTVKQNITIEDLLMRTDQVIRHEIDVTRHQLTAQPRRAVGRHRFVRRPAHRATGLCRRPRPRDGHRRSTSLIATGTDATQDAHIPFDGQRIFISDDILRLDRLPRTLAVVGAGVIGCEYASMFAALGVRVTLIDKRPRLLPFVDAEIVDTLAYQLRENRASRCAWAKRSASIEPIHDEHGDRVRIHLASGKQIITEKALYSIGRTGATAELNLAGAGLAADDRGRLKVNDHYQTAVPHIYAVGDVIGFPSLASTSMEQGRLAACHAFGVEAKASRSSSPTASTPSPRSRWSGRTRRS